MSPRTKTEERLLRALDEADLVDRAGDLYCPGREWSFVQADEVVVALAVTVDELARATAVPGDLAALASVADADQYVTADGVVFDEFDFEKARQYVDRRVDGWGVHNLDGMRKTCAILDFAERALAVARAHRCAPTVEVATGGECAECLALLDEGQEHASSCSQAPAAPAPAAPEASEAASGDLVAQWEAKALECYGKAGRPTATREAQHAHRARGDVYVDCAAALRDATPAPEVEALLPDVEATLHMIDEIEWQDDEPRAFVISNGDLRISYDRNNFARYLLDLPLRAPEPPRPLAVGDPVTTAEELDALPVGAVVRAGHTFRIGWRTVNGWETSHGDNGMARRFLRDSIELAEDDRLRVLDLPSPKEA